MKKKDNNAADKSEQRSSSQLQKELKKYNKRELLEVLVAQGKMITKLEAENALLKEKINNRDIIISDSGTLAEAALKLSGIFEDAQKAVQMYSENYHNCDEKR